MRFLSFHVGSVSVILEAIVALSSRRMAEYASETYLVAYDADCVGYRPIMFHCRPRLSSVLQHTPLEQLERKGETERSARVWYDLVFML